MLAFKIFIATLILLTGCLSSIKFISGQRCTQTKYVPRPHTKLVPRRESYWDQNWLGMQVRRTRYRFEYTTEYSTVPLVVSVCCPGYTEGVLDCEPICTPECPVNSRCSSPNSCTCNFGYSSTTSIPSLIECKPKCPAGCPTNSSCTNPFQCTCDVGYKTRFDLSDGCDPICTNPCPPHAHCIAPNICSCETGYKHTPDGLECVPDCKNGCPLNMYCKSPDECTCRTGYAAQVHKIESDEQTIVESSDDECIPVCNEGCPAHSKCIAPDECRCDDGYTMFNESENDDNEVVATNSSTCVPVCEQRCPLHASCILPNHCECEPGYQYNHPPQHRPYCQAQCAQNCSTNGKCVAPNVCECLDGYEHVNSTNADVPYCQPKCAHGCPHGTCCAPEVCVCSPGYLMGPLGMCEPICTKNCQNGHCVEPEICACDEGFQLTAHDYSKCEPICNQTCINADCAAPDICLCQDKYKPKFDAVSGMLSAHECEPMCIPECVNADCMAPDQCRCHEGYAPHTNTTLAHICIPHCTWNGEGNECMPITTTSLTTETTANSSAEDLRSTKNFVSSTTKYEEWFTNGLVVESLTTIAGEQHNAAALLPAINISKCNELCYCWEEELEEESSKPCREICSLHNEACLEVQFCVCHETGTRLEYKRGELIKNYICKVNRTSTNYDINGTNNAEPTWLFITGSILIAIMIIAIIYLCVRIYQTRHDTGAHEIPISLLMKL
ncbi:multiple epidermal growth factor-like domains protein 11 [Eurosta solidaginis]|uniref:multiple epidermal growth factor-like domains protein 11 n=1 Tax=Eurosta solidaginis TaxID=178769 RepID=UPI003530B0AD